MKAFLLYRDSDFDATAELPRNAAALSQDLDLDVLFAAMAAGDGFLFDVAKRTVLASVAAPEAITYRQDILHDCLAQPPVVRELYDISIEALEASRKVFRGFLRQSPESMLDSSRQVLALVVAVLVRLRKVAEEHADDFVSQGFTRFFAMIVSELNGDYLDTVEGHLERMRLRRGVLVSAELGQGSKGMNYVLRRPINAKASWRERLGSLGRGSGYSFQIADRDEAGLRALGELRDRGLNLAANSLAQSTDHILSFFNMLRFELGFYVGCLNLSDRLAEKEEPVCFPEPATAETSALDFRSLYDVCLTLKADDRLTGNDVNADSKTLIIVTGANQGGKSTFLRSIGLAQLMMQAGMFVAAEAFAGSVCEGVFTHFKREEDATMTSGKLDEELSRMSDIADQLTPRSIVLFNESFAATNEREGSEIARQIIRALLDAQIRVFFVTHMFDLADGFYRQHLDWVLFLRAERLDDGRRTFRLVEREPLPTSYGEDVYARIFGEPASADDVASGSRVATATLAARDG